MILKACKSKNHTFYYIQKSFRTAEGNYQKKVYCGKVDRHSSGSWRRMGYDYLEMNLMFIP